MPKDVSEPLSAVDTAWFRTDERNNATDIAVLMLLSGELDHSKLLNVLRARLLPHPRFRQRVVESSSGLTAPTWQEDPDFRLERHVLQKAVRYSNGDALQEIVSELASEPLPLEHSPWRICVVHGSDGQSALVVQIHHCMGDGFALLSLLLALAEGDGSPLGPRSAEAKPSPERSSTLIRRSIGALAALARLLLLSFERTKLHQPLSGRRRVAWSRGVPLSTVKQIARARGATVNDVLLATVTAALRRYLTDGAAPDALRAIIPVNLRPADFAMEPTVGNWFGLVFASLPTGEHDADRRFSALKLELDRLKASEEAIVTLALLHVLGRLPTPLNRLFNKVFARKASVVVSNVPGPPKTLRLVGCTIEELMFWAPHPCGLGCGASLLSYAGSVRVGIRSDFAVMPDPARLAGYFDEELARLGVLETA